MKYLILNLVEVCVWLVIALIMTFLVKDVSENFDPFFRASLALIIAKWLMSHIKESGR